ncbi:hypothetical protein B4N89_27945 [Embleya scabrispora]|uniref:Uncharacterized protein n=1 Tax=Embleya scabrispora TaxID=159449 RepID=A0A1T3P5L5_9ACTN|nr:hypothetical protein [Embleya scabrispora]OPC84251.1 hypothetical protein B4N89_27945 [Embleya scabrispora]
MPHYHAAIVHPGDETTYCGIVPGEHVEAVLAACETHPEREPKTGRDGGIYVLRADGDLDHYLPVDAPARPTETAVTP